MLARGWHATIAALVAVALVLQIVVAVRVPGTPHEVTTGTLAGASLAERIIRVFSFFTIASNLLSGVVSAQLAARPDRDGPAWRQVRLAALVGITVTGIVYSTVLAAIHEPKGATETAINVIVHYVVPVMMVLGWLAFGPRPRAGLMAIAGSLLFPAVWFAYTLIRGAIWHWYPYPFLDVNTHGYPRVIGNAVLVTIVLAAVAALFSLGGGKRTPQTPPPSCGGSPLQTRPAGRPLRDLHSRATAKLAPLAAGATLVSGMRWRPLKNAKLAPLAAEPAGS